MAFRVHLTLGLGLLVAFTLAAGCGSSDKKIVKPSASGGAGEAGAAGSPDSAQDAGGAGGAAPSEEGLAGQAGATLVAAGAAGEAGAASTPQAGAAGAGGTPAVECTAVGAADGVSFNTEPTYQVCRGALALLEYSVDTSDEQFTCCGTSDAGYGFEASGLSNDDGGGDFSYLVPSDAPLTDQALELTCASGVIATTIGIHVADIPFPVVDSVSPAEIDPAGTVTVTGSNLLGVDRIRAIPVDPLGQVRYCNIEPGATATQVACTFGGDLEARDYRISVFEGFCGAVHAPTFSVLIE